MYIKRNLRDHMKTTEAALTVDDGAEEATSGGSEAAVEVAEPAEEAAPQEVEASTEEIAEEAPKPTRVPWQTKRIDQLTAKAKQAEEDAAEKARALAEAQARVAAYEALYGRNDDTPSPQPQAIPQPQGERLYSQAEVQAEAQRIAANQALNTRLEGLFQEGSQSYGQEFINRVNAAGQAFGPELGSRVDFFQALAELPNGVAVYHSLAGDLDHMAEVLTMSPIKLGMELTRMSQAASAKPKAPAVSRTPAPIDPIEGPSGGDAQDMSKMSMDDYVKARNAQREARYAGRA